MLTHASPEVLQEAGAIVRTHVVKDVRLVVAPGEPDDPMRAQRFVLSWWEQDLAGNLPLGARCTKRVRGWYFITKELGVEARNLAPKSDEEYDWSRVWRVMFGPVYAVRVVE